MRGARKVFPPGTFIPTPARVLAILQLCIAFTCWIWLLGYPYMGSHFEVKSKKLIYETLLENKERFAQLPPADQNEIISGYESLGVQESGLRKLMESVEIILLRISKFELIWLILAVVIPIALLKKVDGAKAAVWLLPIVALAYAWDNGAHKAEFLKGERSLYPSEKTIMQSYLKEPLSSNVMEQRDQLLKGWQIYLIEEWSKETPSQDPAAFKEQFEKGEYAFDVARIKRMNQKVNVFREPKGPFLLLMYVLWNLIFATVVSVTLRKTALVQK